jgi:hypothetical protein
VKHWMQTFPSCLAFDLLNPTPDMVRIEDIAHHLSQICRYTGGCNRIYTVAEHSLHVSDLLIDASPCVRLQGLLHDATEAYVGDVSSPLKALLPEYRVIEDRIASVIATKFGLPQELDPSVKKADMIALFSEKLELLGEPPEPWFTKAEEPDATVRRRIRTAFYCRNYEGLGAGEEFLNRYFELLSQL